MTVAASRIRGGQVPGLEELVGMTPEELVDMLRGFGVEPDLAAIQAQADRGFERLGKLIDRGQVPDEATWEAIDKDLERRTEAALRNLTRGAIRDYRLEQLQTAGVEEFTWVAVMDKGTCVSCGGRHGMTETAAYWEKYGWPGDASLVCGENCRCEACPAGTLGDRPEPSPF